jgi:mycofactocin precursor
MPELSALTPVVPVSEETEATAPESSVEQLLVEEDLVIEEVSIDGMCGVY